jgi:IS605 OrfB family transposase
MGILDNRDNTLDRTRTFHAIVPTSSEGDVVLTACAGWLSMVKRKLFTVIQSGKFEKDKTKTDFCAEYQISSRQFNAIHDEVKGLIKSNLSNKKNYIADSKIRIKVQKEILCKIRKQKPKTKEKLKKKKQTIRAKEQKLQRVERKMKRLQEDVKAKRVRVAFGTKKLFHAQFHREENRYESHEEWKKDWDYARNNQFFLVGSHDEPWGNQNCQMTENEDKSFNLSLRLPDKLVTPGIPERICFENIRFSYGYAEISAAVQENKERKAIPVKNKEEQKKRGQAIGFRFKKSKQGTWKVFVMLDITKQKEIKIISRNTNYGVVGIDINQDHLAVVETDRFGNPIKAKSFPLITYGKSSAQTEALIGEVSKEVNQWAIEVKKPLVLENLDFKKKKAQLEKESPGRSRQLSSFAYSAINRILCSRAYRSGIKVYYVDPAYTSLIGRFKFATRYGLTTHQAAALVIGRRIMRLSERPLTSSEVLLRFGTKATTALSLPERIMHKPVKFWWMKVYGQYQSAVARHHRKRKSYPPIARKPVGCDEKSLRGSWVKVPAG